ncbi:MAG: zinc-dependent metalloprotease [Gammaproteobacteria bacterium]
MMPQSVKNRFRTFLSLVLCVATLSSHAVDQSGEGLIDFHWQDSEGKLFLAIDDLDSMMIYQASLARGLGSNDIGLDRGQLGTTAMVSFVRVGPKVFLMEHNLMFRAPSNNPDEQKAIESSFARSVLWGFDIVDRDDDRLWVDASAFALRDVHGVAATLKDQERGNYKADATRSAIFLPRTKAFPDNTEIEAMVTFTGEPTDSIMQTVAPDPTAITLHMHHSFVRLPDDGYEALPYDPRAGFIDPAYFGNFSDYAVAIDQPTTQVLARRHRLQKTTPGAAPSPVVEPIIYYVDRGAPEPVRQALIDGAKWWRDAFEQAGFQDAYDVRVMPEGADPMDVRYNVIQWVHRSTRGWSYGASVADPRTQEIIKGHVTLGSLRVRQDFLLAEGLLSPYANGDDTQPMREMALARIRQLSAHEVGHTLGLEHNFAGSADNRSSVMDYPFPLVRLATDGSVDLSDAYAVGAGRWDIRAIGWGYGDFSDAPDPAAARAKYLSATYQSGLRFVADRHSRRVGAMHPDGSLWDNGADPIAELGSLLKVRAVALSQMGQATIAPGRPLATIEETLVPIYLLHRYQIQAVGKLIGGARFGYPMQGDKNATVVPVTTDRQSAALAALLATLAPDALAMPPALLNAIPPRPPGFGATRELFTHATGDGFDPLAPAAAYTELLLDVLLDPTRATRLDRSKERDEAQLGFDDVLNQLMNATWLANRHTGATGAHERVVTRAIANRLIALAQTDGTDAAVRGHALLAIEQLHDKLDNRRLKSRSVHWLLHDTVVMKSFAKVLDGGAADVLVVPPVVPPGSPIGH